MCARCEELIHELMDSHGIAEDQLVSAFWEHTAFPFSSQEESAAQLREWADGVVASRERQADGD